MCFLHPSIHSSFNETHSDKMRHKVGILASLKPEDAIFMRGIDDGVIRLSLMQSPFILIEQQSSEDKQEIVEREKGKSHMSDSTLRRCTRVMWSPVH